MPSKPGRFCLHPGCAQRAARGNYCHVHAVERRALYDSVYDTGRETPASRGYNGQWRAIRAAKLAVTPFCELCGATATVVHHIRPLRDGGTNEPGNLQSLCAACHLRVHPEKGGGYRKKARAREP